MDDQLKKYIDRNREEFDLKEPPAMMWQNIKSNIPNLKAENEEIEVEKAEKKNFRIQPIYYGIAASVILFLTTYFVLNFNTTEGNSNQDSIVTTNPIKEKTKSDQVIDESILDKEENNEFIIPADYFSEKKFIATNSNKSITSQEAIISDYDNALVLIRDTISASNRIKGLALLNDTKKISEDDLKMLRNVSLNDSNSIVRLNALEVLGKNLSKDKVTAELNSIFLEQDDAMVQLELINIIKSCDTGFEDQNLIKKLQEIILDSKSSSFLKDEAYVVLLEKNKL